jgi:hypothetical protein
MRADDSLLRAAASDIVTLAIGAFARWLENSVNPAHGDDEEARAASLLGVEVDAEPDEIRAALRSRIARDNLHPDHGGDGVQATELIAAQNLLLARARRRCAGGFDHA